MTHTEFIAALSLLHFPENLLEKAVNVSKKITEPRRNDFFSALKPLIENFERAQADLAAVIEENIHALRRIKRVKIPKMHEEEENKDHIAAEELFSKQLSSY